MARKPISYTLKNFPRADWWTDKSRLYLVDNIMTLFIVKRRKDIEFCCEFVNQLVLYDKYGKYQCADYYYLAIDILGKPVEVTAEFKVGSIGAINEAQMVRENH